MCGINGIVNLSGGSVVDKKIIAMNEKIAHRGPDGRGLFVDKNVGLGHVRLAIIDLSEKGDQPMAYAHLGQEAIITYNGEIYNFLEIRKELEEKGYFFQTNTDTEVILASYAEYGFNCLQKFNGMFAFVIYDKEKNILFGARDRFGQKPLKYCFNNGQFIFSSELKAILECGVKREIDYGAIDVFLTLQYVPAPRTGFKNIYKLPCAHYFILDLNNVKFTIKRYFDLDYSKKLKLTRKEWEKKIDDKLEKAVKRRLVADVPVGAFLSGGIDSSAIVMMMSRYLDTVKTYSISFDENKFDESRYAKQVAQIFNTDHTEFKVVSDDLLKYIDELVYHYEEPFADSSQLPTFMLSKITKKYATVVLGGDGGDENFGGYDKYWLHLITENFFYLIKLFKYFRKFIKNEKLNILFNVLLENIARRHYNFTSYFDEETKKQLYNNDFKKRLNSQFNVFEMAIQEKFFSKIDNLFYLDFAYYIPDDINVKVDMASMYHAFEVRSPMLDYEFVNLMAKAPWRIKLGLFRRKKIFKSLLRCYLPKKILYRRKQGFGVPIKNWFRNDLKSYLINNILDDSGLVLQIFNKKKIQDLLLDHFEGKDKSRKLWALLVLNIWHKKYFYGDV